MSERLVPHPGIVRAVLVVLGAVQTLNGLYALLDPSGFYEDFPAGRGWVAAYPAYSEHLVRDVGALFLATGVLLLVAAVWLTRRMVVVALVTWLLFAVPHTVFHLLEPEGGDRAANAASLLSSVVLPVAVLVVVTRTPRPAVVPEPAAGARVALVERPTGLVPRLAFRASRRRLGTVIAPAQAYAHAPVLLAGYAAVELAAERSHRCDQRLKDLAVMRAAMLVGCEWCLDFGTAEQLARGVPEDDLRDLATYRSSPRFTEVERLVLDYASAMTRTPLDMPDDLVAALRDHLGDAGLVELTHHVALENHRARFDWALGLQGQGFSAGAYCVPPDRAAAPA
jgi:AhpD family alkylhydroperoxidase